ncbi:MAG: Transposase, partial [uncultured bacterium]
MPSKNRLKTNSENSYYHVYNRGVEKRAIFQDRQDYNVFLKYLGEYLLPKNEIKLMDLLSDPNTHYSDKDRLLKLIRLNNFSEKIDMLSYCLMPNHFHFFIKQISLRSMHKFMQSIGTRYTMYFNRKYKRVGFLYQDIYKAAEVKT